VLITGPHCTGGAFRAQGQTIAVTVGKGIHFFFNDIGDFTNRALKQVGTFDDWRSDFLIAIAGHNLPNTCLDLLPFTRLRRQAVIHTSNSLDCFCHLFSLSLIKSPAL